MFEYVERIEFYFDECITVRVFLTGKEIDFDEDLPDLVDEINEKIAYYDNELLTDFSVADFERGFELSVKDNGYFDADVVNEYGRNPQVSDLLYDWLVYNKGFIRDAMYPPVDGKIVEKKEIYFNNDSITFDIYNGRPIGGRYDYIYTLVENWSSYDGYFSCVEDSDYEFGDFFDDHWDEISGEIYESIL